MWVAGGLGTAIQPCFLLCVLPPTHRLFSPLPCAPQGCALSSNVIKLAVDPASGNLATDVVVRQPWLEVAGWALPTLPPLITDILISLDDKWLFFSNWLRGECQLHARPGDSPCAHWFALLAGASCSMMRQTPCGASDTAATRSLHLCVACNAAAL